MHVLGPEVQIPTTPNGLAGLLALLCGGWWEGAGGLQEGPAF